MILIVGASGLLGGQITQRLLAQGQTVRILVRPTSAPQASALCDAQMVTGDLKDRASLDAACRGVDVVITTANSAMRGGEDNVQTVDLDGNRRLIDAAQEAGVKQFIFTSALGVDPQSTVPFFRAKAKSEAHLRSSGLPYTILAPNIFIEVWVPMIVGRPALAGQSVKLVGEGRRKHTFVSIGDVAAFATAAIGHPAAINQHLPIGGPEALSWRDVVATFERVLGRPIEIESLSPEDPALGLPEGIGQMMAGLEMYDSVIETTELARTFNVRQTTVGEFVSRNFAPAAAS